MDGTLALKKYNVIERIEKLEEGSGYELPIASADTLGGVKIGENLEIDENGVLTANVPESGNNWSTDEHEVGTWIDGSSVYEKSIQVTLGGGEDTDRLLISDLIPTIAWIVDSDFVYTTGSEKFHVYLGSRIGNNWTTGWLLSKSNGLYLRINNNFNAASGLSGYVTIRYVKPVVVTAKKRSSKKTEE